MKNTKKTILIIFLSFSALIISAQKNTTNHAGLYKTEKDYKENKLTYEFDCSSNSDFIQASSLFKFSKVLIKVDNKRYLLLKKDFFGYKNCNNQDYRFFNDKLYHILDTAGFYLYSHLESLPQDRKNNMVEKYYFSHNGSDAITALSIPLLIDSFSTNIKFHYALEHFIGKDKRLSEYDGYAKSYRIKYLYKESLK